MMNGKAFVIRFIMNGEESLTKIHCDNEEMTLNYFNFFFETAELIDIEESIVQILIKDLEPN